MIIAWRTFLFCLQHFLQFQYLATFVLDVVVVNSTLPTTVHDNDVGHVCDIYNNLCIIIYQNKEEIRFFFFFKGKPETDAGVFLFSPVVFIAGQPLNTYLKDIHLPEFILAQKFVHVYGVLRFILLGIYRKMILKKLQ